MENLATNEYMLRELREIRRLLEEHFRRDRPLEVDLPNLVDITFALRKLCICRSTFYKHVKGKLLQPVLRIGNRDYFERHTVDNLHRWQAASKLPYRKLVPLPPAQQTQHAA